MFHFFVKFAEHYRSTLRTRKSGDKNMKHPINPQEGVLEPDDRSVLRRLAELGLPPTLLATSLRVGYVESDLTTEAHPVTYPGIVVWGETTGVLRTGLVQLDWKLDDTDNIARAISPNGNVTVVVVSGNEYTGLRNRHEYMDARRPRGPAGVRIVKQNMQYELLLEEAVSHARNDLVDNLGGTWFLLHYRVDDIIRSELSYAKAVDTAGQLIAWKERLILPDIDLLDPPSATTNTSPDVDVPISRRNLG